jgi:hypothetical protein
MVHEVTVEFIRIEEQRLVSPPVESKWQVVETSMKHTYFFKVYLNATF